MLQDYEVAEPTGDVLLSRQLALSLHGQNSLIPNGIHVNLSQTSEALIVLPVLGKGKCRMPLKSCSLWHGWQRQGESGMPATP